jgi:hypothetical protein
LASDISAGDGKIVTLFYSVLWFVTCDTTVDELIKFKKTASRQEIATGNFLD